MVARELERLGIRQSMSRKGNCLDNAATEQVLDTSRTSSTGGANSTRTSTKRELDAAVIHWNTRRRQIRLEWDTPRRNSEACPSRKTCILFNNVQQSGRSSILACVAALCLPERTGKELED